MCGILGGTNVSWEYDNALNSMYHRGPDGAKISKIKDFFMAFTRLAIVDLREEAMQPMITGDGKYAITFNGEIYGYKEVRNQLQAKGYQFKTLSDTEVLLNAFVEWKEKMVEHIEGIFAVTIMDIEAEELHLFRDRAGVKPLYYFEDGRDFAYASELKAIEKLLSDRSLETDATALYDYFNYLYVPEPKTIYKKIYKLEPATYLCYSLKIRKIVKKVKYWTINVNPYEGNIPSQHELEDKSIQLRELLDNSIRKQLVADVPVGTFFSGGVDSSIVTMVARKQKEDIHSYAIAFTDKMYDESPYVKQIGKHIGANYTIRYFEQEDFQHLRRMLAGSFDEPFGDLSLYPTYFVSEYARKDVTVVLTGDGGDELFGGYRRYFKEYGKSEIKLSKRLSNVYQSLRTLLPDQIGNHLDGYQDEVYQIIPEYLYHQGINRNDLKKKFGIPKDYDDGWYYRQYYHKDLPMITRLRYMDFMTYLPSDILTKVDRMSMKVSLESRVPILDKDLIEFAFSLNQNVCNPEGKSKGLFRYAYSSFIPDSLFDRPKAGFMMPHRYLKTFGNISETIFCEYKDKIV